MSTILRDLELDRKQTQTGPFISLLRMRHKDTGIHSETLRMMVADAAERFAVPARQIRHRETASHLHDLGTIAIPDPILPKPRVLNDGERRIMQTHSPYDYEALQEVEEFQAVANIVLHHHERYDGGVYPHGLEGKNIPFGSRMIAALDAFDAMINDRSYRRARAKREACQELLIGKGPQFDPEIVDALLETLKFSVR